MLDEISSNAGVSEKGFFRGVNERMLAAMAAEKISQLGWPEEPNPARRLGDSLVYALPNNHGI